MCHKQVPCTNYYPHHVDLLFSIHSKCVKKWIFKIEDFRCFFSTVTFFFKTKFFWSNRISLKCLESSKNRNNFWVIQSDPPLQHQNKKNCTNEESTFNKQFGIPMKFMAYLMQIHLNQAIYCTNYLIFTVFSTMILMIVFIYCVFLRILFMVIQMIVLQHKTKSTVRNMTD